MASPGPQGPGVGTRNVPARERGLMTRSTGVVASFDADTGLGTVRATDGAEHGFHCTAIADGTRFIAVGRPVSYGVVAGGGGRWEASDLVTLEDRE